MNNKSMLRLGIISAVAVVSLLIGIVVYYNSLVINLQDTTCQSLHEVLEQEKSSFARYLNADKESMKGYTKMIVPLLDDREKLVEFLDEIVKSTDFEYVFLADTDGNTYNNKGELGYVGDRDYFNTALTGETVISDPVKSKIRDAHVIAVATPVYQNSEICGVLIGSFNTERLNQLFMASFSGYGYTYVATNSGEIIARTNSSYAMATTGDLFELFSKAKFSRHDSYELMRQNLIEGQGGHSQYEYSDKKRLMHYDKLPVNDWNIFAVVSPEGVTATANKILRNAILLTFGLIIIFIGLLYYNFINERRFTREITKMAFVDDVTGYRSFGKFRSDAEKLILEHHNTHMRYMLIKMDIESFRIINEIHSMEIGNQILKEEARVLDQVLDPELDMFGRIHADEFVVFVSFQTLDEAMEKRKEFELVFNKCCEKMIGQRLVLPQGYYILEKGETGFNQIYEKANFAHKMAKISDSKEQEFDGKMKEQALRKNEIEERMESALLEEEYHMFLQPKYRLSDEAMVGAEALVRWIPINGPMIYPNEFIPLFEQNGFITKLDMYMFEQACKILHGWLDSGIEAITISVNFSRLHLSDPDFVEKLIGIADRYQIPHHLLEIELTETAMLDNLEVLEEVLHRLHKVKFTLSMDDFGTGYSSLSLLKDIPVDVIKIDKAFFDQSRDLKRAKTVISSVMDMAQRLDISTVAEGVETQDHIDLLRELGCETVQGYYYAKPMAAEQLEIKMLRNIFKD